MTKLWAGLEYTGQAIEALYLLFALLQPNQTCLHFRT